VEEETQDVAEDLMGTADGRKGEGLHCYLPAAEPTSNTRMPPPRRPWATREERAREGRSAGRYNGGKSSRDLLPNDTQAKYSEQSATNVPLLSGQPALKVRLTASSQQDGNEWAWVVSTAPTAATVWA